MIKIRKILDFIPEFRFGDKGKIAEYEEYGDTLLNSEYL